MAIIFWKQEQHDESILYHQKGLAFSRSLGDKKGWLFRSITWEMFLED
jgi:hypothetical protein